MMRQWVRMRAVVWGVGVLLAGTAGTLPMAAATYQADLAVAAGAGALAAGEAVTLVVPMEQQLFKDLGVTAGTLDPALVRLTTPDGRAVEVQARTVRIAGSRTLGTELRFALDRKVPARRQVAYTLTFQTVGAELLRNVPELPAEPVESTYSAGDWAKAQGGVTWDFNDAQQPVMAGTWHATAEEGVEDEYLVVTADGKYSSPSVGSLAGPFDAERYARVLIRARHRGPTPAKLLLNAKGSPVNAAGQTQLGEAFDLYSIDLAGREGWTGSVEKLLLRWGYGTSPTAEDQIHIDWVRLLEAGSIAFLSRLREVDASAIAGPGTPTPAGTTAPDTAAQGSPEVRAMGQRERPAARPSTGEFFAPAPDLTRGLPKDAIYPRGQTMGLSFYSVGGGHHTRTVDGELLPAGKLDEAHRIGWARRIAADGFTMMGPQYELKEDIVADAQRVGLKAVYTIEPRDPQGKPYDADERAIGADLEAVKKQVTEMVRAVAHHEEIAWWDIKPEEARSWKAAEMALVRAVAEAVWAADPLKRPMFMYEPNHRTGPSLARTMDFQDLSLKGAYTTYAGKGKERIFVRWSVEQQLEGARLVGRDVVPILVPEMFKQPSEEEVALIPDWVRHDVYLGLVTGAKGVVTFSLRQRPQFTALERYYQSFADVAGHLTGELRLADLFLFGERRNQAWVEVVEGPATVTLSPVTGTRQSSPIEYPSVSWLDAAHPEVGRCVVIINSANEPVTVRVGNLPTDEIEARELLTGRSQTVTGGGYEVTLNGLGVHVWRFTAAAR